MKEIQLKSIKGKISTIFSLKHYHFFLLINIHRNENNFLKEIDNRKKLHIFTIWNSLGIPHANFQHYHPGFFMADAMQKTRRLFYFVLCIKS